MVLAHRAYTLLAWDQFIGSNDVGRVPVERKLARVPAPRVFPREPKSLLQANITIDHRSQITEKEKERDKRKREKEREKEKKKREKKSEKEGRERRIERIRRKRETIERESNISKPITERKRKG